MFILSTNVDQKSLETEFSIAISPPTGNKWKSKTLFLAVFDCHLDLSGVKMQDTNVDKFHPIAHSLSDTHF